MNKGGEYLQEKVICPARHNFKIAAQFYRKSHPKILANLCLSWRLLFSSLMNILN